MTGKIVKAIAAIEVAIGASTLFGVIAACLMHLSKKSPTVLVFVLAPAAISISIGVGLFRRRAWAANLLIFFSGYIVLTKALVFAGFISFNGEILELIPSGLKNWVSFAYHAFVMAFLARHGVGQSLEARR